LAKCTVSQPLSLKTARSSGFLFDSKQKTKPIIFPVRFPLPYKQDCSSHQSLHLLFNANMQSKQTSKVFFGTCIHTDKIDGWPFPESARAAFPFFLSAKLWADKETARLRSLL
jgi:hypothetical protein